MGQLVCPLPTTSVITYDPSQAEDNFFNLDGGMLAAVLLSTKSSTWKVLGFTF